jgi:glycosyltransferase involved in cell wall biosynthesis
MQPELTVVLPAYREEENIQFCLKRMISCLDGASIPFRAVVVVDGPGDNTAESARSVHDERISVIELAENLGKGRAIRTGFATCNTPFIGFIDADLDLHPEGLVTAIEALRSSPPLICGAVGSKVHPNSNVEYPVTRRILSSLYKTLVRIVFSLDLSDTQTGLKVFRSEEVSKVLDKLRCDGFEFDLELLSRLAQNGNGFIEIPVDLDYKFKSTVNIQSGMKAMLSTFRLAITLRRN